MKILEKMGWMIFLLSLILLVITILYWIISNIASFVGSLISKYHHNLGSVMLIAVGSIVVGFFLIRLGAAASSSDTEHDA